MILNQKGVSIVQVLIAAAMMGGLSIVMLQMGQNQNKMIKSSELSADLQVHTARINKYLMSQDVCNLNFKDKTMTSSFNPSNILNKFEIYTFSPKAASTLFAVETAANQSNLALKRLTPNFKVRSIQYRKKSNSEMEVAITFEKAGSTTDATGTITNKRSYGTSVLEKKFIIDAVFDGNKLESCNTINEGIEDSICTGMLQGQYNYVTNECENSQLCELEKKALAATILGGTTVNCTPNETVSGIGLHGNIHTIYGCKDQGGNVTTQLGGGKKLCTFNGNCPSGWYSLFNKTKAKSGEGWRNMGCSKPKCTTGFHSSWETTNIEKCTHREKRTVRGFGGCKNRGSTEIVKAVTTYSACY